ncbi:MAG: aspartate carbamoyltransferase, partial [Candidatus Marinimicrobia bacterium]|nr:aspartate carbamoyltransferase [Candidatus Neomarinimicrobiota bacterium]
EQMYLYKKTKELKDAIIDGKDTSKFFVDDKNIGAYLVFLESSTRTKESFLNAIKFHNVKTNIFDSAHSSFNKKESYADTFKMLTTYSKYSIFIIRSKLEGVTRWLEYSLSKLAERLNLPTPAIINGGDGKHEHPTQEILDEYTFLEQNNFDTNKIHIALIGDLNHGRTIHSKTDGLRIFKKVKVDLIAPKKIKMPDYYKNKMIENGFEIKEYDSIEEYLAQKDISTIWYFTRLQLERMGEDDIKNATYFTNSISYRDEFFDKIPEGTKFYHPLPRHREFPTIPFSVDETSFNGYDKQAMNGYFTRTVLISMFAGKLGDDFNGKHKQVVKHSSDFIEEIPAINKTKPEFKIGTKPVIDGIVIDHIGKGENVETIWEQIHNIRKILNLNIVSSHGVYKSHKDGKFKGVLSLPDMQKLTLLQMKKLSAIAPESTLNIIQNSVVQNKYRIHMPPRIYDFDKISCKNPNCISHPDYHESAITEFRKTGDNKFICKYCDKVHTFKEVWNI